MMRRRGWCRVAAMLLVALPVWACAQPGAASITVRDDRGTLVTFAAPAKRIISLLPSLTESVCVLGGCARLVGVDRYSNWPASVNSLPRLGGLPDAQIERIVALRPDVVLVAPAARVIGRLEALGVKVLALASDNHADVRHALRVLGAMLGQADAAAAVWAHIEQETAAAAAQVPARVRGQRVYFEIAAAPYAAGTASFIGETLARLGMANVVPSDLGPFPKLNPEFVVRARPDIVMAQRRSLATMPQRPGWSALAALQDGRSCGFSPEDYELLTRPGPRLGQAAQVLAACLAGLPAPARDRLQ